MDNKKFTIIGAVVTLGIVYGDIGTSPLYTMNAVFHLSGQVVTEQALIGISSLIFWTLTILTTVKYVSITLRADNNGEGGIFALYTLIKEKGKWLAIIAIIGAGALLADGMITPAMTVTSAIEGLTDIIAISQQQIIICVTIILIILFLLQQFGTKTIGNSFGPIMLVWFGLLFILGFVQIAENPTILKALNPIYGLQYLFQNPIGIFILGAIFLCTTGAEALYSDLGHCGRKNIYVTWVFVKICLITNYFGQAAYLMNYTNQPLAQNPFFAIVPEWFMLPMIIIATLAAIIASQALISGSFTLVSEGIKLGLFPRMRMIYHTNWRGQMYIPIVNTFLALGALFFVWFFKSSVAMEAAYGLAIIITMLMTSTLLFFYIRKYWRFSWVAPFVILPIMVIEITLLIGNLGKFTHGGYVTLLTATFIIGVMLVYTIGRRMKNKYVKTAKIEDYVYKFEELASDEDVALLTQNLVYLSETKSKFSVETKILYSIFNKYPKRAENYFFVNIQVVDEPYAAHYRVKSYGKNVHKVQLMLGFRVAQKINLFMNQIIQEMEYRNEIERHKSYALNFDSHIQQFMPIGNITYVIMKDVLSDEYHLPAKETFVLKLRIMINKLFAKPTVWFGLSTSEVIVENTPISIFDRERVYLERIENKYIPRHLYKGK